MVLGAPPVVTFASVQKLPETLDELHVAGALVGHPINVVKAKTVDLLVPAEAEIVIEGFIDTEFLEPEAPFGESHGHVNLQEFNAYMDVTAITRRKDAILTSIISQVTPSESSLIKLIGMEPLFLNFLRNTLGIKGIKKVSMHEPLTNIRKVIAIVCERDMPTTEVWRAMYGAAVLHRAAGKFVIAINEDIDPTNADALLWAMSYRANASLDMHVLPHRDQGHGPRSLRNGGQDASVLIDATLKEDFPPISLPKREYMERAKVIWEELGLPKLKPESPWFGYSLGEWGQEFDAMAKRATDGDYLDNAESLETPAPQRRRHEHGGAPRRRKQAKPAKEAVALIAAEGVSFQTRHSAKTQTAPGIALTPRPHAPHPAHGMAAGVACGRDRLSLPEFGRGRHDVDRNQQGYAGQNARHGPDDLGVVPALHGGASDQAGRGGARGRGPEHVEPAGRRGLTVPAATNFRIKSNIGQPSRGAAAFARCDQAGVRGSVLQCARAWRSPAGLPCCIPWRHGRPTTPPAPASRSPTDRSKASSTAGRCCSPTAARCGSPASRRRTRARRRWRRWWPDGTSRCSGSARTPIATAGRWRWSHCRMNRPEIRCRRRCWSADRPGFRPISAICPALPPCWARNSGPGRPVLASGRTRIM